ncbi:NAD(P)H-binding protein [Mucilaginibacter sp.]|uniref:NAD(P)H-binding protein n=1 Tax=Mucilaginibacter sp. TaxID=1882438 RepID=UPI003D0FF5DA
MANKAIIAGASGLIGSSLLDLLLNNPGYDAVLVLVRKELPIKNSKLTQLIVDFDKIEDYNKSITGDVIFCCLGSTKKKTPDLSEYRKIDHDYPLKLAQIALNNGIKQYHLVSSIGADPASSNFYTKMKGETENDIIKVGLTSLHIYRPSALMGDRKESRPLESISVAVMKIINPLLFGSFKKYRSIAASTVASTMYKQSLKKEDGVIIYPSDQIQQLS